MYLYLPGLVRTERERERERREGISYDVCHDKTIRPPCLDKVVVAKLEAFVSLRPVFKGSPGNENIPIHPRSVHANLTWR